MKKARKRAGRAATSLCVLDAHPEKARALSLRRDSRLVRLVRRREISKEDNARAHDDRYHERPNEIFFPGWSERNLGHHTRVYGLCAVNQRVSIFLDCPINRKRLLNNDTQRENARELDAGPQ